MWVQHTTAWLNKQVLSKYLNDKYYQTVSFLLQFPIIQSSHLLYSYSSQCQDYYQTFLFHILQAPMPFPVLGELSTKIYKLNVYYIMFLLLWKLHKNR